MCVYVAVPEHASYTWIHRKRVVLHGMNQAHRVHILYCREETHYGSGKNGVFLRLLCWFYCHIYSRVRILQNEDVQAPRGAPRQELTAQKKCNIFTRVYAKLLSSPPRRPASRLRHNRQANTSNERSGYPWAYADGVLPHATRAGHSSFGQRALEISAALR